MQEEGKSRQAPLPQAWGEDRAGKRRTLLGADPPRILGLGGDLQDSPKGNSWELGAGIPSGAVGERLPRRSGFGGDRAFRRFGDGGPQRSDVHGHSARRIGLAREIGTDLAGVRFRGTDQLERLYLSATLPRAAKVPVLLSRETGRRPVSDHTREPKA